MQTCMHAYSWLYLFVAESFKAYPAGGKLPSGNMVWGEGSGRERRRGNVGDEERRRGEGKTEE